MKTVVWCTVAIRGAGFEVLGKKGGDEVGGRVEPSDLEKSKLCMIICHCVNRILEAL